MGFWWYKLTLIYISITKGKIMKVENMTSPQGNTVANQFIITDDNNNEYFGSFNIHISTGKAMSGGVNDNTSVNLHTRTDPDRVKSVNDMLKADRRKKWRINR